MKKLIAITLLLASTNAFANSKIASDIGIGIVVSKCKPVTNINLSHEQLLLLVAKNQNVSTSKVKSVMQDPYYIIKINKHVTRLMGDVQSGKLKCSDLAVWALSVFAQK